MKRFFLFILFLALLPAGIQAKKTKENAGEQPLLRVGVLSDVHVYNDAMDSIFRDALQWYRKRDIDAMILAGDFTVDGVEADMARVAKTWFSVFPKDKGRKGRHVERVFVYGNHEIDGTRYGNAIKRWTREDLQTYAIKDHRAEYWKKYFREPYSDFYRKDIKGYTFLAAHYQNGRENPGMGAFFRAQDPTLPKDKPIFYIQHKHPKWTIPWGSDNGNSTRILKNYPNLICFSGHCHISLVDERSIWQKTFTSVNTASLVRRGIRSLHENAKVASKDKDYVPQMARHSCKDSHEGMLMLVYADRVELHRMDLGHDEELGVWIIPNDVTQRPYRYDTRKAQAALNPPQFTGDDAVRVRRAMGKDRNKAATPQVQVFFPVVVSHGSRPRALDYSVTAEQVAGDSTIVLLRRLVTSPGFYLVEARDRANEAKCYFAESALPKGVPIRFAVRPRDSWENEGEAIYSEPIVL